MRILVCAVLFTILFIACGECRPNAADGDQYPNDTDDYDADENIEAENRDDSETNSPSSHILTSPLKLFVHLGASVHLPCTVSNDQQVVSVWKKGDTPLYQDNLPDVEDRERIVRMNNNTLIIHNFGNSDVSDEYICEITSTPPERVVHSVRTSKHLFVLPSETVEVNEPNKTVNLACQANWKPKPIVKWFHEGKRVPSDNSPTDGSSLTIRNVSEGNSGLYQCLVESPNEKPKLYPIHVVAHHAPKIEVENEIVHTGIHMDAELTCRVDAFPQAEVSWFKDGKKVAVGSQNKLVLANHIEINHTLAFTRIEKSDLGKYTCQAKNSIGKAARQIELTGAPAVAKFVRVDTNADGTVPILEWTVESFSPIINYELEYRRNGDKDWKIVKPRVSDDGTGNIFRIKYPLEGLKAGSYEAVLLARNEFGWSSRPNESVKFVGAGSKSGATSIQSLINLRSLLIVSSLLVCTTYL